MQNKRKTKESGVTPASPEMKQESEVTPTSVDEKNNEGAELYKPTAIIYSYIVISLLTPPPNEKPESILKPSEFYAFMIVSEAK